MNRILQGTLLRMERAIERIEGAASASRDEIEKLKEDKQRLTQQYWARGKKVAVMAETQEGYEALRADNANLKDKLRQARDHAARLRALSRALKDGLEP